jgi:hypothetical protein
MTNQIKREKKRIKNSKKRNHLKEEKRTVCNFGTREIDENSYPRRLNKFLQSIGELIRRFNQETVSVGVSDLRC